ncbi:MAG TPA: DUF3313 domain-containing protein [Candidatus Acidoferrum sp.]|nr:DUF3313 domain-containing protein [Candidatus Acidoferrum sp.]
MQNQHGLGKMQQDMEQVIPEPQTRFVTRSRSLSHFVCLGLLLGSLLLMGITTQAQAPSNAQAQETNQQSGFLGDYYLKLQPDPKNSDLLIYWKSEDVLKNANKFILDPVLVYLLPEAQQRAIDPEQLAKLTQYFSKAIKEELTQSGTYQVVNKPGPGVMVLRLALTNVEPAGAKENAALKGAETVATHAVAPGASLLIPRVSVGKVSIEGEMVDSATGDVLVAFESSKSGRRFFGGLKAYEKWGDIDAAFRDWAKSFRERLDKAHGS